jgi:glycosyltransferase involved in cell wall biosynthesis
VGERAIGARTLAAVDPPSCADVERADVTFFAPWIGPLLAGRPGMSAGGAETQLWALARGLAARGRRVAIVVFGRDDLELPPELEGVRIVEIRPPRASSALLRIPARVAGICRTLWRLPSPVLVQRIAGPETGLVAGISRLRRRRFVYSSANVVDFDYAQLRPGRLRLLLFHLGIRLADEIVVQTPEQVELCQARFGRTPRMIKSVAEPAAAQRRSPEAFLWVGRTDWYKRPEAYLELARGLPEARFWMVPMPMNEEGRRRIEELRRDAHEQPNLDVLEARPRAELAALIESAVAVVNTADYEGMPNVFLEGWSRGVPALALSHDPDGVIERERLGGFAGGSKERLVELARGLWRGRDDQAELAGRCRGYVAREHALDAVLDQWLRVLEGEPESESSRAEP